jgi:hypothetical protein
LKVPVVPNVYVKTPPGMIVPESKRPVAEVTVCALIPLFVQQTVVPGAMFTLVGSKKLSSIETSVAPAGQVAGGGGPPHSANLKLPMRERHGFVPVVCRYSVVYQNVQSSTGSVLIIE